MSLKRFQQWERIHREYIHGARGDESIHRAQRRRYKGQSRDGICKSHWLEWNEEAAWWLKGKIREDKENTGRYWEEGEDIERKGLCDSVKDGDKLDSDILYFLRCDNASADSHPGCFSHFALRFVNHLAPRNMMLQCRPSLVSSAATQKTEHRRWNLRAKTATKKGKKWRREKATQE